MTTAIGDPFKSFEGMLWVLPDGPNSEPLPLGCHMLGDISKPEGDNEPIYCKDNSRPNSYRAIGKIKGQPGLVDASIETDVTEVVDYLESLKFPATIIATQTKAGRLDRVTNWDVAYVIPGWEVTNRTWSGLVGKDTNERSNMAVTGQGLDVVVVRRLRALSQGTSETQGINAIFFCDSDVQQGQFSTANKTGDTLFAVADAASGQTANVLYKIRDAAWTAMASDPFAADEPITAGLCVALDRDTTRVMVFRGVEAASVATKYAQVAYTDDFGANWTVVDIGTSAGEYITDGHAVFALDDNNVWASTSEGRVYFSNDGGASWTVQEDAFIQVDAYNYIEFVDSNNGMIGGADGTVAVTADGGGGWSQVTVPSADAVKCGKLFNPRQAFVGTDGGELFYTNDAGVTWAERDFSGSGTGVVESMAWYDQHIGFMVHTVSGSSSIFFTKDGGYTWERVNTVSNNGINHIIAATERLAFAVGEVVGSTGLILRIAP